MRIIKNLLAAVGGLALFALLFMLLSLHPITRPSLLPSGSSAGQPTGKAAGAGAAGAGHPALAPAPQAFRNTLQVMLRDLLPPPGEDAVLPAPQSAGAKLLRQYCAQCHSVPAPGLHTADQWPGVVARMTWRAQMLRNSMGVQPLPATATAQLVGYLQQYALAAVDPSRYADISQPDGQAFLTSCGQCHAAPDPKLHAAGEWPAIAGRMRNYVGLMGKQAPDATTWQQALAYLQRNGR